MRWHTCHARPLHEEETQRRENAAIRPSVCECLQTKALRTARSIKTDVSDALLESSPTRHFATHLVEMALRAPAKQEMRRQAGVGSPPKGPKRDASPTNASPAAQRAAAAGGTGWLSPDEKAKVEEERVRLEAEAAEVQRQAEEERKQKAEAQRKEEENRKAEMKSRTV